MASSKRDGGLTFDLSDFERKARELKAATDQLPFALANALNSAAFAARKELVDDVWPGAVEVRNPKFLSAALRVEKATKSNLAVSIVDTKGRGNLKAHAEGGVSRPLKASKLAIPVGQKARRTGKGVVKNQRPAALIARTPPKALRVTPRGIFTAEGGRLQLRYAFAAQARIKQDVPFHQRFQAAMRREIESEAPRAIAKAMKSRRKT